LLTPAATGSLAATPFFPLARLSTASNLHVPVARCSLVHDLGLVRLVPVRMEPGISLRQSGPKLASFRNVAMQRRKAYIYPV
jgi:hypothetical protein